MTKKKFTIDRSKWGCGDIMKRFKPDADGDLPNSALLDSTSGAMCCLGFYAESCGISKKHMEDVGVPSGIRGKRIPKSMWWLFEVNQRDFEAIENKIAAINDDEFMPQKTREAKIRAEFAKQDIEVEFVGRLPRLRQNT